MDAYTGQRWATRALFALVKSGMPMPENLMGGGMESFQKFGVRAFLYANYEDVAPLLDEMLAQATLQHGDARNPPLAIAPGPNCVVEEIRTFLLLQKALINLHTGFFEPARDPISNSGS